MHPSFLQNAMYVAGNVAIVYVKTAWKKAFSMIRFIYLRWSRLKGMLKVKQKTRVKNIFYQLYRRIRFCHSLHG